MAYFAYVYVSMESDFGGMMQEILFLYSVKLLYFCWHQSSSVILAHTYLPGFTWVLCLAH